ncbi:MAG: glycogen/starch synthase [Chloroflexota bacterium]
MNILFVAAESTPYVKVGGLADVVGTLPGVLNRLGQNVRVVLPHHGLIDDQRFGLRPYATLQMDWNGDTTLVEVSSATHNTTTTYFIRGAPFFDPSETFIYSQDEGIDVGRFLFFAAAVLKLVDYFSKREGWQTDVFHTHDWHTGTLPFLLTTLYKDDDHLGKAASVFSIHNLRYQGWGVRWHLDRANLPPAAHPLLQSTGKTDNSLAIGLAYSTTLSTVSPTYAQEITLPDSGDGLDDILHARSARLTGILNGIDVQRWNPATSPHIVANFDRDTLPNRARNKLALQAEAGLPRSANTPLVGTVMRLVEQKGPSIMFPAVRHLLENSDAQFILLGAGQPHYESEAQALGRDFPGRAHIRLSFNETLAERIYAGIDAFLMPSLFEPCGIGQMFAMRYGALPIVRHVGGLVDTVPATIGFAFADFNADALIRVVNRALDIYTNAASEWRSRQQQAMQLSFDWQRSASQYIKLYQSAIKLHASYR